MAGKVNREENSPEAQSGEQNLIEVEESGQSAVSEDSVVDLENLLAQRDEGLAKANARLLELEQVVAGKDSDIAGLKQSEGELTERLTSVSSSLAEAVSSYKATVVQANPDVLEELISGDTIEAINQSLSEAESLVSRVRQGIEAEISLTRFPAGAPARTLPDLSALSPREKIQYAIGGKR